MLTASKTVEDGLRLENKHSVARERVIHWLTKVLSDKGFQVMRNYLITVGDVTHRIDVVAVINPIGDIRITTGFIVVESKVTPELIEMFSTWKIEGKFDKLVIVALDDIDVNAYELALKLGLAVVKVPQIVTEGTEEVMKKITGVYEVIHYHPKLSMEDAMGVLASLAKKGLFSRKHKEVESVALIYLPFYVISADIGIAEPEEEEVKREEITITFDGVKGYVVVEENDEIKVVREHGSLADLSEDALAILKQVTSAGYMTIDEVMAALNIGEEKVKALAGSLMNKSLVDIYADVIEARKSILKRGFDIREHAKSYGAEPHSGLPHDENAYVLYPRISLDRLVSLIESLSGRIKGMSQVYLPFYAGLIVEKSNGKETRMIELVDALSGRHTTGLAPILRTIEQNLERFILTHGGKKRGK